MAHLSIGTEAPLHFVGEFFCVFITDSTRTGNDQPTKGHLISKANFQAVDSPKKRTDEFLFYDLKSCYVVKSNPVRSFFWRIYGLEICFQN